MANAIVGVKRRVIIGWRHHAINRTLDFCSTVEGYVEISWDTDSRRPDILGRLQKMYKDDAEQKRMWARRNRSKANANSKKQWEVQKAKTRVVYLEYRALYSVRFPGHVPVGEDRFRKVYMKAFQHNPEVMMFPNPPRSRGNR